MSNKSRLETNNTNLQSILSTVQGLPNVDSVKRGTYVWKKLSAKGGTFLDFVVSDNANAYPDGGTQSGYWYEKVVEGKAGVDVVFFTPTEDTLSATVTHTLGKMPSNVAVCRVKGNSSDYSANHVLCAADTAVSAYNGGIYYGAAYSYSSASGITTNELSFTENLISYASSYYRLEAGVTYAFIAIG